MGESIKILGTMSGSSLDGLDMAIVEFSFQENDSIDWAILHTGSENFDPKWKKRLEKAPTLTGFGLASLDAEMGIMFGEMCRTFIEKAGVVPDYIASHGHTVMHAPKRQFTVQVGKPSHIAAASGIPVIADFRSTDIAHGGQGAPLAPIAEQYLFSGFDMYLNLGGIANLSAHSDAGVFAWDICPCNQLLNYLAEQMGMAFDDEGKLAASGQVDEALLNHLQSVIALPHNEPYSLDNSFILTEFIPRFRQTDISIEDQLRTAVEYITQSISLQCQHIATHRDENLSILITGGSAHNSFLIECLKSHLEQAGIDTKLPDTDIIDFKEAILIGLCGLLRLIEVPNALGSVTGASQDTVNGGIYLPS